MTDLSTQGQASHTPGFHVVRGYIQTYDWGVVGGMAPWQPDAPEGRPQAELWFGDHPKGPSPLVNGAGLTLGDVRTKRAPLLLKLLAAAHPLSLQVHPDDTSAESGMSDFVTSTGAPVLVDADGKDEMVLAISDFHLLAGFRPAAVAGPRLRALGGDMASIADIYRTQGPVKAAAATFTLDGDAVAALTACIDGVLAATDHHPATRKSMRHLVARHGSDPAVLVAYMLQHRVLAPGEALHVAPGTPHAYLHGTAVEVMTNSDNVLRLGFTKKPLAIDAALSILRSQPGEIIVGAGPANDSVYYAGDAPFLMRKITRDVDFDETAYRVVLCVEGSAVVSVNGERVQLSKGQALVGDDWSSGHAFVAGESVVVIAELA
jgi:mannose-6-phosphate isomerase